MGENILALRNISKAFYGIKALSDVSIRVEKGEVLGIIGENGAGKSTLMNIVGGVLQPDSGDMLLYDQPYKPKNTMDANASKIAFIHQELNLCNNLTVAENIFLIDFPKINKIPYINKREMNRLAHEAIKAVGLQCPPDTLIEKLSQGERQLVEIAKAFSMDAQVIIFDEPTTSLTARETERLFKIIGDLKQKGRSIIYISHILSDIQKLTDRIVVLRDGNVTAEGTTSSFNIDSMIFNMIGRDMKHIYPERKNVVSDEKKVELVNITKKGIVSNINLHAHEGEVVGIFGLMGSGRTELMHIFFGLDSFESGEIKIKGKLKSKNTAVQSIKQGVAFVTENRREEGLMLEMTVLENLSFVAMPNLASRFLRFIDKSRIADKAAAISQRLRIKSGAIEKSAAKSLSGGNQQKVVIGKWLMTSPEIFIVDEPTRGIDVGAKFEVYSVINNLACDGAAVLVVSSEIEELMGICDRIYVMSRGEITGCVGQDEFDRETILRYAFGQCAFNKNASHESEVQQ